MLKRMLALLCALLLPCVSLADTLTLIPSSMDGETLVSCSPDGSAEIYAGSNGLMILRKDGSMLPVVVNEARGVPDFYRNLEYVEKQGAKVLGSEGFVWSPDSRYAAIVNQNAFVFQMRYNLDPVVIDMQTGDMFLLDAYASKSNQENCAVMLTCTFSEDSRYMYAVLTGGMKNRGFFLRQYDLTTLEATTLYAWQDMTYWPHLVQLADGSFLLLKDAVKRDEYTGLVHIINQGGYAHTVTDFGQPVLSFYPRAMQYSPESGHALIFSSANQSMTSICTKLVYLRPDDSLDIPEEYWVVPSLNADCIEVVNNASLDSLTNAVIRAMCLSPEGERALLLCSVGNEFVLRILNLADGTLTPVTGVDSDTLMSCCRGNNPYMVWLGDVVILGQTPANASAYRLN